MQIIFYVSNFEKQNKIDFLKKMFLCIEKSPPEYSNIREKNSFPLKHLFISFIQENGCCADYGEVYEKQ